MKRYFMQYDSDKKVCGSYSHVFAFASSIKTAKGYIGRCRKAYAGDNPRNFRIYDTWADVPEDEHVPCVYHTDKGVTAMMRVTIYDTTYLDGTQQGADKTLARSRTLDIDRVRSWEECEAALQKLRSRYPASRYEFDNIKSNDE